MKLALLTTLTLLAASFVLADDPAPKTPPSIAEKREGAAPVAEGEDVAPRPQNERPWGFTFKQKGAFGNQSYRMSDTSLDLEMPYGLDLNADLNAYSNSTSSTTPTITFGAGWTNGLTAYTGTYAITTLANDYEAAAIDFGVSVRTDSEEFRTLLAVDVNETHHRNFLRFPKITSEQDLSQRSPTAALSQRLFGNFDTKITLSQSSYNKDLLAYTRALNTKKAQRAFGRYDSNLTGLIDGFPDWSVKFGLDYDFDAIPLTLRGTYQTIHLEDTAQGTNTTADVFTYAADYDVKKWVTLTAEYDHTRQTSQPITDEYGAQLALRF